MNLIRVLPLLTAVLGLLACHHSSDTTAAVTLPPGPTFTVGGSVTGPTAQGLVLADGSATVATNVDSAGVPFTFGGSYLTGTTYAVTVQTAPAGLTCSVANGSGTVATADITNVVVTCSAQAATVNGTVNGLTSSGLVIANGTDKLEVRPGATSITLPTVVADGSTYQVTVAKQPSDATCSVQNGTSTMGITDVTNITVTCAQGFFTLGGSVSGLSAAGLVLANGTDTVPVPAGATSFTLPTTVPTGSPYAVTVSRQPTGATCTVNSEGSGTVATSHVTDVTVTCSDQASTAKAETHTLEGTVTGLTTTGLVLTDGTDEVSVAANAITFSMPTGVAYNTPYRLTIASQPQGATCQIANASGTMPAVNVTTAQVTCN